VPRLFDVFYRYWRGGFFCELAIEECHNFASKSIFLGGTWKPVTIPALFGMSESFSVPYDTILQLFWRNVSGDRGIFPASEFWRAGGTPNPQEFDDCGTGF
jgi:hypothetical protein